MTTAYWRDFWGDPSRRTNPYGTESSLYAKGYHRGEDIAPQNGNLDIPALRAGVVEAVGQFTYTGYHIAVDVGGGRFDIYCHVYSGRLPAKGSVVSAGEIIGRMATYGEVTGSAWTGPHVHFVVSGSPLGASSLYSDYDPRPIIRAALADPGEEMPSYILNSYDVPKPLPNGTWTYLRLNDANDVSFAIGGLVSAVTNVVVTGLLPGDALQLRYLAVDPDGTEVSLGLVEVIGTTGSTLGQISGIVNLGSDKRLRVQALSLRDGVSVDRWGVRALKWED